MGSKRKQAEIRKIKPDPTLGEVVRALRDARGLSQETLATRAGTAASYISRLESGLRSTHPRRDKLVDLAQAMSLTTAEYTTLMSAAGYDLPDYDAPSAFASCVTSDPLLNARQKRTLVDLYAQFVGNLA